MRKPFTRMHGDREAWRKRYVGAAGGSCIWSRDRGCHGSNVRFVFRGGPSPFSYAEVGSVSLAYVHTGLSAQALHLGFFGIVAAQGMFHTPWVGDR